MARNRMIKPEFWEDYKLAQCSRDARLMFIAMLNFADDKGYLPYEPTWIKAKCMPYDDVDVQKLTQELLLSGRLEQKNDIIKIVNFLKHQKIDKPKPSSLSRKFKGNDSTNVRRQVDDDSTTKREEKENKKLSRREENRARGDATPKMVMENFIESVRTKDFVYEALVIQLEPKFPVALIELELEKFISYWTELNQAGTKHRWQLEKFFDVKRRLSTWFGNVTRGKNFNNNRPMTGITL